MKSKAIIILLAIIVVGGGVGAYLLTKNDTSSKNSSQEATQTSDTKNNDTPSFNPLATNDDAFIANMEVVSANEGESFNGSLERKKTGDIKFSGTQGGDAVEFYVTANDSSYIFCQAGECYKLSGGDSPIKDTDVTDSDEDIVKYKESAVFKGTEACVNGTCDVWEYTDEENEKVTVLIARDNNRVIEMRSTDTEGSKYRITYDYTEVSFDVPTNVQEIPGGI